MVLNHFPENSAPSAPDAENGAKWRVPGAEWDNQLGTRKMGRFPHEPRSSGAEGAEFPPLLPIRANPLARAQEQSLGNSAPLGTLGTRP